MIYNFNWLGRMFTAKKGLCGASFFCVIHFVRGHAIISPIISGVMAVGRKSASWREFSTEMNLFSGGQCNMTVFRRCFRSIALDRKSTRLNSSHIQKSRMPSSA